MARTELIKELELRRGEIYSEVKAEFPELIEELAAIDKILSRSSNSKASSGESKPIETPVSGSGIPPKGDHSWNEYILMVLEALGGKAKSREVAKAIVESNNDITPARARDASSDKLSRLLAAGKITAIKPRHKKEGYTYETELN